MCPLPNLPDYAIHEPQTKGHAQLGHNLQPLWGRANCAHVYIFTVGARKANSWQRTEALGKSPRYMPLFTSGNLCGKGWDLLLCKGLIQPLQDGSRSRRTSGSLRASTYPGPSAGTGPWSSGCSQHSPSASPWVVRITSAHLQHNQTAGLQDIQIAWASFLHSGLPWEQQCNPWANSAAALTATSSCCKKVVVRGTSFAAAR